MPSILCPARNSSELCICRAPHQLSCDGAGLEEKKMSEVDLITQLNDKEYDLTGLINILALAESVVRAPQSTKAPTALATAWEISCVVVFFPLLLKLSSPSPPSQAIRAVQNKDMSDKSAGAEVEALECEPTTRSLYAAVHKCAAHPTCNTAQARPVICVALLIIPGTSAAPASTYKNEFPHQTRCSGVLFSPRHVRRGTRKLVEAVPKMVDTLDVNKVEKKKTKK